MNYKKVWSTLFVVFLALGIELLRGEAFSRIAVYLQQAGFSTNLSLLGAKGYAQFPYPTIYSVTVTAQGQGSGSISGNLSGDNINATYSGSALTSDNTAFVYQGSGPYTISAAANADSKVSWSGCDGVSGNGTALANCTLNPVNSNKTSYYTFFLSSVYNYLYLPLIQKNYCGNEFTAISIAVGGGHTCALTPSGGVKCWGKNFRGELGDGTSDRSFGPH